MMFRLCDSGNLDIRKEVFPLKKIRSGGFTWSTCQVLLGWVIDTVNMNFSLPPNQDNRSKEILAHITTSQKRIGIDKWNWVLGDICSVDTTLPGAWGLFRHMP